MMARIDCQTEYSVTIDDIYDIIKCGAIRRRGRNKSVRKWPDYQVRVECYSVGDNFKIEIIRPLGSYPNLYNALILKNKTFNTKLATVYHLGHISDIARQLAALATHSVAEQRADIASAGYSYPSDKMAKLQRLSHVR